MRKLYIFYLKMLNHTRFINIPSIVLTSKWPFSHCAASDIQTFISCNIWGFWRKYSTQDDGNDKSAISSLKDHNIINGYMSDNKLNLKPSLNSKVKITLPVGKYINNEVVSQEKLKQKTLNHKINKRKSMQNNRDHSIVHNTWPTNDNAGCSAPTKKRPVKNMKSPSPYDTFDEIWDNVWGANKNSTYTTDSGMASQNKDYHTEDYRLPGLGTYQYKRSKQHRLPGIQGEVLYGLFPVLLALQQGSRYFHKLFVKESLHDVSSNNPSKRHIVLQDILHFADKYGIEVQQCKGTVLTAMSGDRPHQGVCLDASRKEYEPLKEEDFKILTNKPSSHGNIHKLCLYLESVKDPMNFGSILRTSYYLGVDNILCNDTNSCKLSPVVSKASSGALELQHVYSFTDLPTAIQILKEHGWLIVGTCSVAEKECHQLKVTTLNEFNLSQNTMLLLGNEGTGLSDTCLDLCDQLITITPRNKLCQNLDSLNVNVATGIILHHIVTSNRS